MGKLIDTDGLETVLTAANNTFLKNSGGTVTGNIVFTGGSGQINGYDIEGTTGNRWGLVPIVEKNVGAMEVGSRIRFHTSDTDTTAGAVELQASSSGELTLNGDPIAKQSSYAITNLSGDTSVPAYFWARNNSATLVIAGTTPSGQWGADTKSYTIPSDYRPPTTMYFPLAKTGTAQGMSYLQVDQDGTLTIQNWGGTQSAVNFFCTATWTYMNP